MWNNSKLVNIDMSHISVLQRVSVLNFEFSFNFQRDACDDRQVGLRNVTRAAEGTYECQVSGEGPHFSTVSKEKELRVAGEIPN